MSVLDTWHIHIEGQVQGVGFRPFVYTLAQQHRLGGWVKNAEDGVHIEFNARKDTARFFLEKLIRLAPALARITRYRIRQVEKQRFHRFCIVHSSSGRKPSLLLTPDFALCDQCRMELQNPSDRRHGYPFISCTQCGPRYSIIRQLPYDRERTTMQPFMMCRKCTSEYEHPADRRYYSQINSCPACPVNLTLLDTAHRRVGETPDEIIATVAALWKGGQIVAIKGIGGYLLTCDASDPSAIERLRARKNRPTKPLALMYPGLEQIAQKVELQEEEIAALCHPAAPILLVSAKQTEQKTAADHLIAPGLSQIGVMLPYTPLYYLLLRKFGGPIVATSGNVSHSPIIYQDEKAVVELRGIADYLLVNDRHIVVPQDDSVVKFSSFRRQRLVLRRSRGYGPTYINAQLDWPGGTILSTGAMLKSSFGLLHQGNTYISQYLGDLQQFDTLQNYRHTVQHFLGLFDCIPEAIITDRHPDYPSTRYGEQLAKALDVPLTRVQHHVAHFAAVLAENDLIQGSGPVLGIIWDGTGLGDDGQIWGGEFFTYDQRKFVRCAHFDYFRHIAGDKMALEPRLAALSCCRKVHGAYSLLKNKFSATEWKIYHKLLEKEGTLQCSSVGRIFDAVASLLGIMDLQNYEGEAALRLEDLAMEYFQKKGLDLASDYFYQSDGSTSLPTAQLLSGIVADILKGESPALIAARFHCALVELIVMVAKRQGIKKLAFSGGVFQNGLLVDLLLHHLQADHELYFHRQLSPNDENIAFGQLVCYHLAGL